MNKFSLVAVAALIAAAVLTVLPMLVEERPAEVVTSLPRTERVVDLPEDGDQWQLVIIYTDKTRNPADRAVAAMFATTPRLQSLVAQTKVYEYPPTHWWAVEKLQGNPTPAVILQAVEPGNNARAKVVYKASGPNLPMDGEVLADEIQHNIETMYPQVLAKRLARDCPNCPQPLNRPDRKPANPRIPDLRLKPGTPGTGDNSALILLLLGGSAAAAWLAGRKRN
jgi:hypothetical protein